MGRSNNKKKKMGASQTPNVKTKDDSSAKKKEKIEIIVHETTEVDPDSSNEEIQNKARSVVGDATYALVMKGKEKYVTNTGGSKLLEELGSLRGDLKSLQSEVEKHEGAVKSLQSEAEKHEGVVKSLQSEVEKHEGAVKSLQSEAEKHEGVVESLQSEAEKHKCDLISLQSKVDKHEAGFQALLDVRERAFLTWLRDFWRDHGAGTKAGTPVSLKARIQSLNQSIIHGGYAIVDALMIKHKGLRYEEEFIQLYGLSPAEIEHIGAREYNSILQVLNAVGSFRFAGLYLRKTEEEIFDKVVELAIQKKWEEAEQAATEFPFVPGFVQLQNVDGED